MIFGSIGPRKVRKFSLSPAFLQQFEGQQPNWGFDGLGYFVYKRTYARPLEDGGTEEYWQTCRRVVEGVYNIQKIHCRNLNLPWNEPKAQNSAQEMFQRMWEFKFLPPGRGLWVMGTDLVYQKGSACLQNCSFISTDTIDVDFAAPFCFLMDMSMFGVGVGGDTRGTGKVKLQSPRLTDEVFEVEDTREGWVDLIRTVLNSFAGKGSYPVTIDFGKVRPRGAPLKTFGGVSSGPDPLVDLVKNLTHLLLPEGSSVQFHGYEKECGVLFAEFELGEETQKITSTQITDIFNFVGKCIVSGGIRRTAEIIFGDPWDDEFLELKSDDSLRPLFERQSVLLSLIEEGNLNGERAAVEQELEEVKLAIANHPLNDRRWASNNSVLGTVGMDYSDVAQRIIANGEPGILWLENARKYSRTSDPADYKDHRAMGSNPCSEITLCSAEFCLSGDTRILTSQGYKRIDSLVGTAVEVASVFSDENSFEEKAEFHSASVFCTGVKPTLVITTIDGRKITITENHPVLVSREGDFEWIPAGEVLEGDTLVSGSIDFSKEEDFELSERAYALGHLLGDGWFLKHQDGKKMSLGFCAGPEEEGLIHRLAKIWETLIEEADPFIETAYDNRYSQPLKVIQAPNGVLSVSITKPHVHRMVEHKFGFKAGTAPEKRLPSCYWEFSAGEKASFLRGLYDADGSVVTGDRKTVSLTSSNEELARDVMVALSEFGITARLTTHYIPSRGRSQTILHVRGFENLQKMSSRVLFVSDECPSRKAQSLAEAVKQGWGNRKTNTLCTVRSVEEGLEVPVYNLEVPATRHYVAEGLVVHNCNLVETFPAHHESLEDYIRTLKFAYLYSKTVTLVPSHEPLSNTVMMRNRRIGCSISGIQQAKHRHGRHEFVRWMRDGYDYIKSLDRKYSEWLCVPQSIKHTTVKPSGTTSLLAGATPGIHYAHSEYYIRHIRVANTSPLISRCLAAGYRVYEDPYASDTSVIAFPVHEKEFHLSKKDVSIWEQMLDHAMMQDHWSDNQVSQTVTFSKEEEPLIQRVLETFESKLKSVSFLPLGDGDHGYQFAPYVKISKEEYEEMAAELSHLDLSDDINTHEVDEKFCDGDKCVLPGVPAVAT